jgi:aspartate aminotransferase
MPEGAFYAFVDVRELLGTEYRTSADVADRLLNVAHIVATDGNGFGAPGFIRFSYATSIANLERAVDAMKAIFNGPA